MNDDEALEEEGHDGQWDAWEKVQGGKVEEQSIGPQVQDSSVEQAGELQGRTWHCQEGLQEYDAENAAPGTAEGIEEVRSKMHREWQVQGEGEVQ